MQSSVITNALELSICVSFLHSNYIKTTHQHTHWKHNKKCSIIVATWCSRQTKRNRKKQTKIFMSTASSLCDAVTCLNFGCWTLWLLRVFRLFFCLVSHTLAQLTKTTVAAAIDHFSVAARDALKKVQLFEYSANASIYCILIVWAKKTLTQVRQGRMPYTLLLMFLLKYICNNMNCHLIYYWKNPSSSLLSNVPLGKLFSLKGLQSSTLFWIGSTISRLQLQSGQLCSVLVAAEVAAPHCLVRELPTCRTTDWLTDWVTV